MRASTLKKLGDQLLISMRFTEYMEQFQAEQTEQVNLKKKQKKKR